MNYDTPWRKTRTVLQVVLTAMLVLGLISAGATPAAATPDCDEDDVSTAAWVAGEAADAVNPVAGEAAETVTERAVEWAGDKADCEVSKSEADGVSNPTVRYASSGGGGAAGGMVPGVTAEQNERLDGD